MTRPSAVAVVPAAGASRRMGRDKLLLPWGSDVVLGAVLSSLRSGGVGTSVVVGRPTNFALEAWMSSRAEHFVKNPEPDKGMLSSIQCGLSALEALGAIEGATALLISPGDIPGVAPESIAALVHCVASGAGLAVPGFEGRRGHPLAISPTFAGEIHGLDPEVGLRELLDRRCEDLRTVEVEDPAVVRDLDTPAEYEAAPSP